MAKQLQLSSFSCMFECCGFQLMSFLPLTLFVGDVMLHFTQSGDFEHAIPFLSFIIRLMVQGPALQRIMACLQ
jgi:hypothetical protein